ncbi:hypothetical protein BH10PSE7_BH10PSE7_40810 [soil metagenome]
MLWKDEWKNPLKTPNGMTLRDWVQQVRVWEEAGALDDPGVTVLDLLDNEEEREDHILCLLLCWRRRCRRSLRCRHRTRLGIQEHMPELILHCADMFGEPEDYDGPIDAAKMKRLAELLPPKRFRRGDDDAAERTTLPEA